MLSIKTNYRTKATTNDPLRRMTIMKPKYIPLTAITRYMKFVCFCFP